LKKEEELELPPKLRKLRPKLGLTFVYKKELEPNDNLSLEIFMHRNGGFFL